ncbi:MAG: GDSL-type esterase/lipase family protein [Actinomycetota bacterium]
MGASDTVGIGADDPETEAWVAVLHECLPDGSSLHRLGVEGCTTAQALAEQLPVAEAICPDVVTIWLVINDLRCDVPLNSYRASLNEVVRRAAATGALVLVGNMPDLVGMPEFEHFSHFEIARLLKNWNRTISEVAEAHGAVLVDLMSVSQGFGEDKAVLLSQKDRFHPSTLGHLVLAEIFFHYLEIAHQSERA